MKIFLVLPAYNESSKVIDDLLKKTTKYLPSSQIIVVDDGSKKPIVLGTEVVTIRHSINLGKGAALNHDGLRRSA